MVTFKFNISDSDPLPKQTPTWIYWTLKRWETRGYCWVQMAGIKFLAKTVPSWLKPLSPKSFWYSLPCFCFCWPLPQKSKKALPPNTRWETETGLRRRRRKWWSFRERKALLTPSLVTVFLRLGFIWTIQILPSFFSSLYIDQRRRRQRRLRTSEAGEEGSTTDRNSG